MWFEAVSGDAEFFLAQQLIFENIWFFQMRCNQFVSHFFE